MDIISLGSTTSSHFSLSSEGTLVSKISDTNLSEMPIFPEHTSLGADVHLQDYDPIELSSKDSQNSIDTNMCNEYQQKSELCSYLKLMEMKMSNIENGHIFMFRHSKRLKNQQILAEQRELERKLSTEVQEKDGDHEKRCMKSCEELAVNVDVIDEMNVPRKNIFEFSPSYVPFTVIGRVEDFDSAGTALFNEVISEQALTNKKAADKRQLRLDMIRKMKRKPIGMNPMLNIQQIRSRILRSGRRRLINIHKIQERNRHKKKRKAQRVSNVSINKLSPEFPQMDRTNGRVSETKRSAPSSKVSCNHDTPDFKICDGFNLCNLPLEHQQLLLNAPSYCNLLKNSVGNEAKFAGFSQISPEQNIISAILERLEKGISEHEDKITTNPRTEESLPVISASCVERKTMLDGELTVAADKRFSPEVAVSTSSGRSISPMDTATTGSTNCNGPCKTPETFQQNEQPEKTIKINGLHSTDCIDTAIKPIPVIPVNRTCVQSLHRNLTPKRKPVAHHGYLNTRPDNQLKHWVDISKENGNVLDSHYFNNNLIVTQDLMVSFWTQSPMGEVIEAANMWVPRGCIQRLALDSSCVQKRSSESVICFDESSCAYVELWIKEHKSDYRERPVADVFAVVYYLKSGTSDKLDKKFLQLENINGFSEDVCHIILKNSGRILVSWRTVMDAETSTIIHCYQLSNDYATVVNVKHMESIDHNISSLHCIRDCPNLVMAYGERKVTIWNVDFGYVIATIDVSDSLTEPRTVWAKSGRGLLFTLQHYPDGIFRFMAINGTKQSWKKLNMFKPPRGYTGLQGVSIMIGYLICFYSNGVLCWNFESGKLVTEKRSAGVRYLPSGDHVITLSEDYRVTVKSSMFHAMPH